MRIFKRKIKNPESLRRRATQGQPATVFSYHANRSSPQANTGRNQKEDQSIWTRFNSRNALGVLPVWLSSAAIVVALLYVATLTTTPKVIVVADQGTLRRDVSEYSRKIETLLQDSAFNRTKASISTTKLESQISQALPEISDVQVAIPLLARQPVVRLTAAKPVCIISDSTGSKFYVRDDGIATLHISEAPSAPGNVVQVIDQSGLELHAGQQVITKDTTAFIEELSWQLDAKSITMSQLVLPATPHEIQMRIKGEPYFVRFNTSRDARKQIGTFLALRNALKDQSKTVKEYIDVRVEERAYYK